MKHIQRSWPGAILLVLFLTGCGGGGGSNASSTPPPTPIPSGTLTSASGTAIDSDTNDPMAGAVGNNTPETAQAIPNPVRLGGFAAATATGEAGDVFATQADEWDSFRTTLSAGQTVTLTIADHPGGTQSTPDLDLYLAAVADLPRAPETACLRVLRPGRCCSSIPALPGQCPGVRAPRFLADCAVCVRTVVRGYYV